MSDPELLERWRAGDQAAGSQLFDRHFKALYRFFRSKVDCSCDDLVQDTLLACVRSRDRLDTDVSFRAYMFGTARRRLMKHYATKGGARVDFTQASVADLSPGAGSILAKRQEDQLIIRALRTLPIDYQIALELHEWEGLTGPEIATVLAVPEGTVRSRIRRARIQLRQTLEELAASPALVESTMTRLEQWADAVRELVDPPPA